MSQPGHTLVSLPSQSVPPILKVLVCRTGALRSHTQGVGAPVPTLGFLFLLPSGPELSYVATLG